ncbi:MAG: hypothetical protein ABSB70_04095 [Candidatus Velthaea sp.]
MACSVCSSGNHPRSVVCRACEPQLHTRGEFDADSTVFESHLTGLAKRVQIARGSNPGITEVLRRRAPAVGGSPRGRQPAPSIDVDKLRVVFGGPHGARIEPLTVFEAPYAEQARRQPALDVPETDMRGQAGAAIWQALASGATVLRVRGSEGSGATTLMKRLAAGARQHGFPYGAVYAANVVGPPADVAQRIAALLDPAQRLRFYTASDRTQFIAGRRFLVLLDGANLTVEDVADLSRALPDVRFVIADAPALAQPDAVVLGPLAANCVVTLLEETYGRRLDDENLRAALDLCATAGSLPGYTRLIGVAARVLGRSFISLSLSHNSGEAIIRELVAGLPPAELRILSMLVLARVPLAAHHVAYVVRSGEVRACLDHLVEYELIGTCGPTGDLYEVPGHVEHLVPPLTDTDTTLARIFDVLGDVFDSWQAVPVLDRQLTAAEALLQSAAQRSAWKSVLALGPRVADALAARGAFGGWGRVLDLVEAAATQLGDAAMLDFARHDQGIRAVVIGDNERAVASLESAARARRSAGDDSGADASAAALALVERKPAAPAPAAAPPARPPEPAPAPSHSSLPGRSLLLLGFGIIAVAIIVLSLHFKPSAAPVIRELSVNPVAGGGGAARLCVDAANAAVVEVFPDAVRLPSGKHCLHVAPAATTTYVAVGTSLDGRQVRRAVTVAVKLPAPPAPVRISRFSVSPARVLAGGFARLCYAVSGAHELRIVPRVGPLTQLRSCQTLTLREPHRYRYTLSALGEDGQVAVRDTHVDVVAAAPPPPRVQNHSTRGSGLIQRAVYQFDATPNVVERGQATSLCVGVGRPARGFVTHVGALSSGITRCYRVQPRKTTVYRLYVALADETAVQSVTVAVRPASRRVEATRTERR